VASGISWTYLREVIARHNLTGIATFKVGTVNPLPENGLKAFVGGLERVLILEELEPFIEKEVKVLMFDSGKKVIIMGKGTGNLGRIGDYNYDLVEEAVGELLGESLAGTGAPSQAIVEAARRLAPQRPLPFCPGCPHRGTYTAMSRAFKELGYKKDEVVVTGDIGCTILGMHPPFDMCWNEVSMGASIALAIGYKYAGYDKPVVATIGDSTFFHAGIPPAINAVWKDTDIVIAVLDNRITAMTGHQLSPSSDYTTTGEASGTISIEAILEAAGVRSVTVVDPYDLDATKQAFVDALKAKGPTAVVLRRTCSLVARRLRMIAGPSRVDLEKCTSCLLCLRTISCPAMSTGGDGKVEIDHSTCNGCAICVQICPFDAITPGGEN
jgi:indolepyruvate ferredoxin oxidoreductase alpha subunit